MIKITERDLIHHIIDKNKVVIPNFYLGRWECDVFAVTKSDYTVEYEIKNSVADFRRDANKSGYRFGRFSQPTTKHEQILHGERTNRFFFVMPLEILDAVWDEIPNDFGVISHNYIGFTIVRQSKRFHNRQIDKGRFEKYAVNLSMRLYKNGRNNF